jgi:phosphohistidine phosphatase
LRRAADDGERRFQLSDTIGEAKLGQLGETMRTLMLMRHAKSSWDRPELDDLDRPLAPRGQETAPVIARYIKQSRWQPDLVLCSPATRVRDTWHLMAPVLGGTVACKTLRAIYPGAPSRLLETLRRAADEVATLMLIGHNPGLGQLALSLCGSGPRKALERMRGKFPTAALAVIEFDIDHWNQLAPGAGRLRAFVRPKDLA